MLYLFLISIGAKSNLADIGATPAVFGFGVVTLVVHILLLLVLAKFLRLPMFLFASASMANIGGTVSASVVARVYNSSLIPIAVIISVLGYVMGIYGGLLVGLICGAL
jgi:Predicted integral membrane protein